ncbi:uncharacterized protein LOC118268704 [Spodoptera frugiperda]|uniref:Uncharacterized protein LOC118268704 n=1 Tax=Spodoptera frugiperda TaxID=7108 RepID=A0A9R0EJJ5_SPOFR|nr:uncharacterized protein LOC118268704 [Spodoptera frugiperda]
MEVCDKQIRNHTFEHFLMAEEPTSELGLLAAKIALYSFEWRYLTVIIFNTVEVIGLKTFLKTYRQPAVVRLGKSTPTSSRRSYVKQMVIFGEDSSEISSTLRWVVRSKYDSNGKFIIICAFLNQECDEIKIFKTLHDLYMTNVLLLKPSQSSNRTSAYSYRIATMERCNNYIPYKLNISLNCRNDECLKGLFKENLSNFHRCSLYVSTINQPPFMYLHNNTENTTGIDAEIMQLAADMLNANLKFIKPSDSLDPGHYTKNNWTGSLGDIYNKRIHISACSAPLTSNKYGNFQISFTYYSMDIVWAARLPSQKSSWEKLLSPLTILLRVLLVLMFFSIGFGNTLCNTTIGRKLRTVFQIPTPKYSLLFYSWILFLGMPILRSPTRKSFLVLVYTWIWFCFVIRSVYQAALINSLKNPAYLPNLKSFQDVIKDGYPFGGLATLRDYYSDDRAIYDRWIVLDLPQLPETLNSILDGTTDFVLASNKEVIKHYLMQNNGLKKLQIIPEKIVNSPTVLYYKKFSPVTTPLNAVLRTATEAGFIQRTFDRYLDRDRKLLRLHRNQPKESLKMEHFTGCFVLIVLGWAVAVTYFVVEYICGNLRDE